MFSSCLLLTFQDNFYLYQASIALLPASIRKYHFNDFYSHCGKGRFFVKPRGWFSMLRLNSHEGEKGTSNVPTTSDRHCSYTSGDMCCWSEGSGTQYLSGAPLTFFSLTGRPPVVLKHTFMQLIWHLQEAQANSHPWSTTARHSLDC